MEQEFYIEVKTSAFDLLDYVNKASAYGGYVDIVDKSYNAGYAILRTIPITEDEYRDLLDDLRMEYGDGVTEVY
jgi:hypothetical protein